MKAGLAAIAATLAVFALAPGTTRGDVKEVLSHVPADAPVAVVLPDMAKFSDSLSRLGQRLNLAELPGLNGKLEPVFTQLLALKMAQVNWADSMAIIIAELPAEADADPMISIVLPVKDAAAFLADNGVVAGAKTVTNGRQRTFTFNIAQAGGYVLLARNEKLLGEIVKPAKALADAQSDPQKDLLAGSDIYVHGLMAPLSQLVRQRAGAVKLEGMRIEGAKQILGLLSRDAETLDLGVALGGQGIGLRALAAAKEGSKLAESLGKAVRLDGDLIANVPVESFVAIGGAAATPPADTAFVAEVVTAWAKMTAEQAAKPEQAEPIARSVLNFARLVKSSSFTVLPTAGDGQLAAPLKAIRTFSTTDGVAAAKAYGAMMNELAKLPPPKPVGPNNQPAAATNAPVGPAMTLNAEAETIEGVKVDVWRMTNMAAFDPSGLLKLLFGAEPVLRVGVKDNMLVTAFAEKPEAMAEAIKAAAAGTRLVPTEGHKRTMGQMVRNPNGLLLLAADRAAAVMVNAAVSAGQKLPPFPKVDDPIGLSYGFAGRDVEARLFVPYSVIFAAVNWTNQAKAQAEKDAQKETMQPATPAPR